MPKDIFGYSLVHVLRSEQFWQLKKDLHNIRQVILMLKLIGVYYMSLDGHGRKLQFEWCIGAYSCKAVILLY